MSRLWIGLAHYRPFDISYSPQFNLKNMLFLMFIWDPDTKISKIDVFVA